MKTAIKRIVMWAYGHGLISENIVRSAFDRFDLRSA